MRFTRVAASVVAGAAGVVLVGGAMLPAQASVTVTAVGWWTSTAAPPTAPDGGIAVSSDPSGTSVAALKLDIGGGVSSATVKLVEAANQIDKTAAMQVCGAADSWAPASGSALAQAPADSCNAGSVPLTQQTDGSWTADLHQLLAGKTDSASVIIKPAANSAPFQVAFDKPTVDGATLDTSSSSSGSSTDSSSAATSTSSQTSTSPSSSFSTSTDSGSSSMAAPSFTTSAPASASAVAPSVAPAPDASAAPAPAATSSSPAASDASTSTGSGQFKANLTGRAASSAHHSTRGTALGLFVLSLLIGAGAAGASWAKAQGLFDMAGLRQRFIR